MTVPILCVPSLCRCGLLNCEAVLELLLRQLVGTSECERMVRTSLREQGTRTRRMVGMLGPRHPPVCGAMES